MLKLLSSEIQEEYNEVTANFMLKLTDYNKRLVKIVGLLMAVLIILLAANIYLVASSRQDLLSSYHNAPDMGSDVGKLLQGTQNIETEPLKLDLIENERKVVQGLRKEMSAALDKKLSLTTANKHLFYQLKEAPEIYNVSALVQIPEIPFCLIVTQKEKEQQVRTSLERQRHNNLKMLVLEPNMSYYQAKELIRNSCEQNSLLMFVNKGLEENFVHRLNKVHAQYNTWVTYIRTEQTYEVISFYWRLYDLLQYNDFTKSNAVYLKQNNMEVQAMGLLELGAYYSTDLTKKIMSPDNQQGMPVYQLLIELEQQNFASALYVNREPGRTIYTRSKYNKLIRMSHDFYLNVNMEEERREKVIKRHRDLQDPKTDKERQEAERMVMMMKALDRQQLMYLPANHPIQLLALQEYNEKYKLKDYGGKEVPFCVTVLNHNNVQKNRLFKSLQSIAFQDYDNYHIVFIDDHSTDNSTAAAIQYLKKRKFSQSRLTFIQNFERKYATYNIVNAAINFCNKDDVQLLLDADDQLIGRHSLQIMNAQYQANPQLLMAFSTIKDSEYTFWFSAAPKSISQYQSATGEREYHDTVAMMPIRTWRVQLIYAMPLRVHLMGNNQWLDIAYDEALRMSTFQLSGVSRIKYVHDILYEYNTGYGDNDSSSEEKLKHRFDVTYGYIMKGKALKPIEGNFVDIKKDEEVQRVLLRDRNYIYREVFQ